MSLKPKKKKGGFRQGAGRKKIERPPEVADKQFAARVLALVGSKRWKEMLEAVAVWRAYSPPLAKSFEAEPEPADKKKKPELPPEPPPHPKTLVESDEDLALYYLVFNDDRSMFVILMEKRDGKAMHTVNHLHDKPIEMNVNVSMAELVREVRQRKQDYERTRKQPTR